MCGIIGKWSYREPIDLDEFIIQRDTMILRGPDDKGLYINHEQNLALGYRRLSINDLSETGNQPISNEDSSIFLVCNGEIYNSPKLKEELIKLGHQFKSRSDAEVIIHGYEEWGTGVLKRIEGMFAFGIWDSYKIKLLIARDRFGIKPLYFEKNADSFTFSSSLKAITSIKKHPKKIDISSICDYLTYRYVPSPKTIYLDINKLEPAHYLYWSPGEELIPIEYLKLTYNPQKKSKSEIFEEFNSLLNESVKKHLMSDVPIGCFLSSGYDSNALITQMSKLDYQTKAFSIGYSNWVKSEHDIAKQSCKILNTEHEILMIDDENFPIDEVVNVYDEPIADISILPTYQVSKMAAKKVKTVFSGEGADELLGGYHWYSEIEKMRQNASFWNRWNQRSYKNGMEIYKKFMAMGSFDLAYLKEILQTEHHHFIPDNPYWFYDKHFDKSLPLLKSFQLLDIRGFMGELVLTKVDRASMAHSLEVRVPFLDYPLVDFLFNLHPNDYFTLKEQKPFLKNVLKEKLPHVLQREKQGFVGSDRYYERRELYNTELLKESTAFYSLFNRNSMSINTQTLNQWQLWKLFVLKKWMDAN